MREVIRSADPRIAALIARQATQYVDRDQIGLDRITALLSALGDPHRKLPPVFHVAGTNGKGSTCALLRAGLEAAGHRVHMFTSPHLVRYNERIRIAGTLINDAQLAEVMGRVLDANDAVGASLFEVNTAAAFIAFAETPADACVIEVGLGGQHDATNVVAPVACGIASVGIDHEGFLGSKLSGIAIEKAGIAKRGVPLVSLAQAADAEREIIRVAADNGAPLHLEGRDWVADPTLRPALPGAHQLRNANLAWQMLGIQSVLTVSREAFEAGLATATWPARFQRLPDGPLTGGVETWLDGAHNVDAAAALAALLSEREPMHLVLGFLANKDAAAIVELLRPHALSLSFVPIPDHDAHDPEVLATRFGGRAAPDLDEALAPLPAPRLIVGSLYLAGVALSLNGSLPD